MDEKENAEKTKKIVEDSKEKGTKNAPEKEKNDTKNGSKKGLIITVIVIAVLALICAGVFVFLKGSGSTNNKDKETIKLAESKEKANIKKNETSTIKYEKFDNGLVSFEYPAGWKVEIAPVDYIHYCFKIYNPQNPTYMLIYGLKQEGALKSEKARQVYASLYPDAPFSKITPIDPQTTEGFYKAWNGNSQYNNESLNMQFFPMLNDFTVIDNLGTDMVGGDILRASFTDSNGKKAQGIFTAAVKSIGTYYISENMFNPFGVMLEYIFF